MIGALGTLLRAAMEAFAILGSDVRRDDKSGKAGFEGSRSQ